MPQICAPSVMSSLTARHTNNFLKVKLILFDLDGTLVDTMPDIAAAVNHALAAHGLSERTLEEIRMFIGDGAEMLIRRACGDVDEEIAKLVSNDFMSYYWHHLYDFSKPYDGIYEAVSHLKAGGVLLAVVTNKPSVAAKPIIDKFFNGLFDVVLGVSEPCDRKPQPTQAINASEMLGVSLDEAIMIGDSGTDVETAKNACCKSCAVLWGYRSAEELAPFCPDMLVSSPSELKSLI